MYREGLRAGLVDIGGRLHQRRNGGFQAVEERNGALGFWSTTISSEKTLIYSDLSHSWLNFDGPVVEKTWNTVAQNGGVGLQCLTFLEEWKIQGKR